MKRRQLNKVNNIRKLECRRKSSMMMMIFIFFTFFTSSISTKTSSSSSLSAESIESDKEEYGYETKTKIIRTTTVTGRIKLPNHLSIGDMKIYLDHGKYTAFVRQDGRFMLKRIPEGKYLLTVVDVGFKFATYKINVGFNEANDPTIKALKYMFPGAPRETVKYPLLIEPQGQINYFDVRQGYNFLAILRSPTILMMLPMIGLFACMKFMVDPEELKKYQQQQQEEAAAAAAEAQRKNGKNKKA